jgi:RNA-binding protein
MSSRNRDLVRRGSELKPTVHVGKEGITEGIIDEIVRQIKDHELVKVRLLPSSDCDRKEAADELAERSDTRVVEVRGNTVLICHKRLFQ